MGYMPSLSLVINTKSPVSCFHQAADRALSFVETEKCLLVQLRPYRLPCSIFHFSYHSAQNNARHSRRFLSTEWSNSTIQCCPCLKVAVASWLPWWASLLRYHPSWRKSLSCWATYFLHVWLWCSLCSWVCLWSLKYFPHLLSDQTHFKIRSKHLFACMLTLHNMMILIILMCSVN